MATTQEAGRQAELAAEKFLNDQGFKLINRNFAFKTGEIDLIMARQALLIFVEVRMRRNGNFGSGADTVTYAKQQKIIRTAQYFLQKHGHNRWQDYRFDVISIADQIDWIHNAFTLD